VFRRIIGKLLEGVRLRRIGKGEWSADFDIGAREVRAELPNQLPDARALTGAEGISAEVTRLVEIAPAAAILQEWNKLEDRVKAAAALAGLNTQLLPELLRGLVQKGAIQSSTADAILGLRNMRNLAVHAPPGQLTSARATEFVTMADAVTWNFEQNLKKAS
jgi:hypothetical protein